MNPANLPNDLDTAGETGLFWTIVRLGVFAVLMVWTAVHLLRKLPRDIDDDAPPLGASPLGASDEGEGEPDGSTKHGPE